MPQSFSNTSPCFIFLPAHITRAYLALPQSLLCSQCPVPGPAYHNCLVFVA